MRELSLFTGAGGGLLGTKLLGWESIGYVEINDYCQRIIKQRIDDGILDEAPIFGDIRTFIDQGYAESYYGMADVITAGFPCQPFSIAGNQKGEDDKRNMWPETIKCIRIIRPRFALLENVPGLLSSGYFGRILGDLVESGFDIRWCCISPVGKHERFPGLRLWMLATSSSERRKISTHETGIRAPSYKKAPRTWCKEGNVLTSSHGGRIYCFPSTDTVRSFNDVANWVERNAAIGNGQVPAVVAAAWSLLNDD